MMRKNPFGSVVLAAAAFAFGLAAGVPAEEPAKPPAREPDARGAVEAFLDAALSGRSREAATLGHPGSAWTDAEKLAGDFAPYQGRRFALHSLQTDAEFAMAITERIAGDDRPDRLVLYLTKKSGAWRVAKIDVVKKEDGVGKRQDQFLEGYPGAVFVVGKAGSLPQGTERR